MRIQCYEHPKEKLIPTKTGGTYCMACKKAGYCPYYGKGCPC